MSMSLMVVGAGGREHAICWSLAQDPDVVRIVAVPGNPGIESLPQASCIPAEVSDLGLLADIAETEGVDVTVVGPEQPLTEGIVDYFRSRGLQIFGPSRAAARLESSKSFAKDIMQRLGVPTPNCSVFEGAESIDDAASYIEDTGPPWVIKADGLAAGKGVLVTSDKGEAVKWAEACLRGEKFGRAGTKILVEEFAEGKEASVLVVTDGKNLVALPTARDHKRLYDGDEGPNTGGMGAYSPVPEIDDRLLDSVLEKIFEPILDAVRKEAEPYLGVLYGGLVLTEEGPKVLEFNVRFGDPEAQAILVRLGPDLAATIDAAMSSDLDKVSLSTRYPAGLTVVAASSGYPNKPITGDPIEGIDKASEVPGVTVFQAGTAVSDDKLVTAGGRVLAVSAVGEDLDEARDAAYEAISEISFEGMHYRTDIAKPSDGA
jgi:phosphoribosylamine--glycine ligase